MITKYSLFLSCMLLASSYGFASHAPSAKSAQRDVPRLQLTITPRSKADGSGASKSSSRSGREDDQPPSGRMGKQSTPRLLVMVPSTAAMVSSMPNANVPNKQVQSSMVDQPMLDQNLVVKVVPPSPLKLTARTIVPSISTERVQTPGESKIGQNTPLNVNDFAADRSPTLKIASKEMEADSGHPTAGQKLDEETAKQKAEEMKKKAEEKQKRIQEQFDSMDRLALECIQTYQRELNQSDDPRTFGLNYELVVFKEIPIANGRSEIWEQRIHIASDCDLNPMNPVDYENLKGLTRDKIKPALEIIVKKNWPKEELGPRKQQITARAERYLSYGMGFGQTSDAMEIAMRSLRGTIERIWKPTCWDAITFYACCKCCCLPKNKLFVS